ncbi:MAG: hypothetical protein JW797_05260 [Bradymonadales bacterium]|nr:hypothetical protein [Bradymonadales bacterium]
MSTGNRPIRWLLGLLSNKVLWLVIGLGLIFVLILQPAYFKESGEQDNRPPAITWLTNLQRISLDRFHLVWLPADDDATPQPEIRYDVGLVDSGFCVVTAPRFSAQGEVELDIALPSDLPQVPFVGFSVRSVDLQGASSGYGPCRWSLRSPQRVAIDLPRRPIRLAAGRPEPVIDCRSDGQGSIWCLGQGEIGHLDDTLWSVFPLPTPLAVDDWVPIDNTDAIVQSGVTLLHLNRVAGNHLFFLSSDNEPFDRQSGAIRIGRESAFLVTRGYLSEFTGGRLELSGPPMALRLPASCLRLLQVGYEGDLAFALCRSTDQNLLFTGQLERRIITWQEPHPIQGNRIDGITGTERNGMAGAAWESGVQLVSWQDGERSIDSLEETTGASPPRIAVGGSIQHPVVLAEQDGRFWSFSEDTWHPLPDRQGQFDWHGMAVPQESCLVGTPRGVYAISPSQTLLIEAGSAERILTHPLDLLAVRGQDARHYLAYLPEPRSLFSSRDGWDWHPHPLGGPPFALISLAISPSGGIYLSGWYQENEPDPPRPRVIKLGEEQFDLTPSFSPEGPPHNPPLLAADGLGRIYALADGAITWRHSSAESWAQPYPLGGEAHQVVGLASGILVTGTRQGAVTLWRCQENDCFRLHTPDTLRSPPTAAFARQDGFCLGVESAGLWCKDPEERWIPITFPPDTAARHLLAPGDRWAILDGLPIASDGRWLVAIRRGEEGFLAEVLSNGEARLIGQGMHWGQGEVLLRHVEGTVYALESQGPFRLPLREERFSLPGMLY